MEIYVSTYAKYNNDLLFGEWVDVEQFNDKDEFYQYCKELHSDEEDAEFMFQEWKDIPERYIEESWVSEDLWDEFIPLSEDDKEIVLEYWAEVDDSVDIQFIKDKFIYQGDVAGFIDVLLSESGLEVPSWVVIDKDKTWDNSLSLDYECTSNYIFSNY